MVFIRLWEVDSWLQPLCYLYGPTKREVAESSSIVELHGIDFGERGCGWLVGQEYFRYMAASFALGVIPHSRAEFVIYSN